MKLQKPRPIQIDPCLNGFLVRVGCQVLAYDNMEKMLSDLRTYLTDPHATEKTFIRDARYNTMDGPIDPGRPPEVARTVNNPCCGSAVPAAPMSELEYRAVQERADRTIASMAESLAPRQDEAQCERPR